MTRYFILLIVLMTCGNSHGQFLKANGTAIINESGDTVILRGMGLGGWMLQEGYMFRLSNIGQQYRIREKIRDVVGEEKADQFYDQWLTKHTTKADIDSMAAWGFNSIRLPMHYGLFTLPVDKEPIAGKQTWLEKGFAITDSLLKWCSDNKMYLILDMHATPGGQGNDLPISDRDPSKPSLWESEANKEKLIALWEKLAIRYSDEPWIGGYEIINEPNWGFEDSKDFRGIAEKKNEPLKALMVDITNAIRKIDKKHIIIIEGNGFGNNYNGILPAWDDNMVLSFHKYGNFNNRKAIANFLDLREKYNIPLWLGESGENSNTWFTEAIQLAESNGIGWAWWQLKKMGINNPLEIKRPDGYDKLQNYWAGKGPKPDAGEAWNILEQLLHNLEISQDIYHPDVIDAMFRQVHSTATKPFKLHLIKDSAFINAVDFDMGRQRYAYYDKDSARYQYTPGVNTDGNKGHVYRNDGVDIQQSESGPYVFSIEDEEWLKYTVHVQSGGNYMISLITSGEQGSVSVEKDGKPIVSDYTLPLTGGNEDWIKSTLKKITLNKGSNVLVIKAVKGGFNFKGIQFKKIK